MEKMLSEDFHLSDEEKVLKLQVEQTMAQLYQLCDDLREKNSLLEVTVYDHFQEIRRQIDIRHEEANCSNDKLYMNMIGRTNHTQAQYMEHLKKETDRAFVQSQYGCSDKERTILKDVLRDPLLVNVKTIKARLEEEIVHLKAKSSEFEEIKEIVKANELKVGDSLDHNFYGELHLVEPSICAFKSKIVNTLQYIYLMRLCEFSLEDKWTLIYRASEDGFGAEDFHSKCDGICNTLTLFKPNGSSNIFGGFTSVSWDSRNNFKEDVNAFIFSLVNTDNNPIKMKVSDPDCAICCDSSYGPTFGCDIIIAANSNTNEKSFTDLGSCYTHPQYEKGTDEIYCFLAGSHAFKVSNIEVYARSYNLLKKTVT